MRHDGAGGSDRRGEDALPGTAPRVEARPEPVRTSVIVGGGPAGLFAAASLASGLRALHGPGSPRRYPVILLERGPRAGRKLLASGAGRCNIAHDAPVEELLPRYGGGDKPGSAGRFLKHALYALPTEALLDWFRARGLDFETEEGGKVFPASRRARDVLDVLLADCARNGVELRSGGRVLSARVAPGGGFSLGLDRDSAAAGDSSAAAAPGAGGELAAELLLLATGGASYPGTGSTGDGYALAASLGQALVPPRPALAPVLARPWPLAPLAGLSFAGAGLVVRRGGKRVLEAEGDLLITHEGLSGPLILDSSRALAPGDLLELRFAAADGEADFESRFRGELEDSPRALVRGSLARAGLPKSMAELFCALAGLDGEARGSTLPKATRSHLARLAGSYPVTVAALGGWDSAMVTAGGVALPGVDPRSMESRDLPGLFFAGELLDVDGDTGGYNLHAAFATGALAARGMLAALAGRGRSDAGS